MRTASFICLQRRKYFTAVGLEKSFLLCYNGDSKNPPRAGAYGSFEVGLMICDLRSDHNLDHLQLRTMWELWTLRHEKARFSDKKAPKSTQKEAKDCYCFLWEHDAAGSSPVTPTKTKSKSLRLAFCFGSGSSSCVCFAYQVRTLVPRYAVAIAPYTPTI